VGTAFRHSTYHDRIASSGKDYGVEPMADGCVTTTAHAASFRAFVGRGQILRVEQSVETEELENSRYEDNVRCSNTVKCITTKTMRQCRRCGGGCLLRRYRLPHTSGNASGQAGNATHCRGDHKTHDSCWKMALWTQLERRTRGCYAETCSVNRRMYGTYVKACRWTSYQNTSEHGVL